MHQHSSNAIFRLLIADYEYEHTLVQGNPNKSEW